MSISSVDAAPHVPVDVALNPNQKKTLESPYNEHENMRLVLYAAEKPKVVAQICCASAPRLDDMVSALYFGGVGLPIVNGGVKKVTGKALLKGSAIQTALIGAAAVAGGIVTKTVYDGIQQVKVSADYLAWKKNRAMMLADKAFMEIVENDEILRFFKCPISGQLPLNPVITPDGNMFDGAHLIRWMQAHPNQRYKGMDTDCNVTDLRFDYGVCNTITKRFRLFQSHVEHGTILNHLPECVRDVVRLTIFVGYIEMNQFRSPTDHAIFASLHCVPKEVLRDKIIHKTNRLLMLKAAKTEQACRDTELMLANSNLTENERIRHVAREFVKANSQATIIHLDSRLTQYVKWLFGIKPNVVRTNLYPQL